MIAPNRCSGQSPGDRRGAASGVRPLAWIALLFSALATASASADLALLSHKLEAEYWGGIDVDHGGATLSRLTLRPSASLRIGERWRANFALRAEHADDATGLGTVDTYSGAARPWLDHGRVRIEIDRATLTRRVGTSVLIVGKQTVPWGVLDGLQVTDRFDAVRRRDFVLTDVRPERLSRWGLRWQGGVRGFDVDAAVLADATVTQLARRGDAFEPLAPRLRGGLPATSATPRVRLSDRDAYLDDATLGLRVKRRFGSIEASVLTLSGPDTDPVLGLSADAAGPVVLLDYRRRRLHGATLEGALGGAIWRLEAAVVPDQPVNVRSAEPLTIAERRRWLVGAGLDVNAPGGWFVNAQVAVDRIEQGQLDLTRPHQDVIGTLRAQRGFLQDTLQVRAEVLCSLNGGDGLLRPVVEWRGHNHLQVAIGSDLLFGHRDGLFGQYRDDSRVWVRLKFSI